jgi:predicted GNAT superfamily acetyltransferase
MTPGSGGPAAVEESVPVDVRPLCTLADYTACVRLQRETWGEDFADYVPASLLKIGQKVGGVTVGAFTPQNEMVGFVFGLTGVRDGKLIHWSHMLAVKREWRNHGLGRRLKEFQRELLRGQGIEMIYWTFDPLAARNAHLNLNRLGTEIREYVPDMYGDTGSPLHAFGTDRFVVGWPVAGGPRAVSDASQAWRQAPMAMHAPGEAALDIQHIRSNGDALIGAPLVRVEVPTDIEAIPIVEARAWRAATRPAFVRLLGHGYRVIGFYTEERKRSFYVLAQAAEAASG